MKISWRSPLNLIAAIARALWSKIRGGDILAPNSVIEHRRDICAMCPHNDGSQCKLCTCFVEIITMIASKQCPDAPPRWKRC